MKFMKAAICSLALLAALSFVPQANAQTINPTIVFAGAGSTAVLNAIADTALSSGDCGANLWTDGAAGTPPAFTNGGIMKDVRSASIPPDGNTIFVIWNGAADGSTATQICLYVAVDSSIGVRGMLANPRAVLQIASPAGTAGANKINGHADTGALPQFIYNAINFFGAACFGTNNPSAGCGAVTGVTMNAAFSDIRPEDAEFATNRAISVLPGSPFVRSGLGYGNWPNPFTFGGTFTGTTISSAFSAAVAIPSVFNMVPGVGDPFTNQPTKNYATFPVGAVPIMILVSNDDTTLNTGFGNGNPGPYQLQNIDTFVTAYTFDGVLTRTRDLIGVTGAASTPMEVITREPLSGTYNTFEFTVPRSHQVQASQEDSVDPSNPALWNPINFVAASGGIRYRAIGTGEMVKAVAGTALPRAGNPTTHTSLPNRIGYAFWSYGNLSPLAGSNCVPVTAVGPPVTQTVTCTTNPKGHYLLLNGVDPIYNTPFDNPQGALNPPTCNFAALPCPAVKFPHIDDGSYIAWTVVRYIADPSVASNLPGAAAPSAGHLYSTMLTDANYSDFNKVNSMSVFRIHRDATWGASGPAGNQGAVNGNGDGTNLCQVAAPYSPTFTGFDMGAEVGGAIWTKTADLDFALDFQGAVPSNCNFDKGLVGQTQ